MKINQRPSPILSATIVSLLILIWGGLRVFLFSDTILPLTYVLPLLVCVWTGRRWQLWIMAGIFSLLAAAKTFWLLPEHAISNSGDLFFFGSTLFNIILGGVVVHAILNLRENLEKKNATISAQYAELEAQAEELSQQNEEIKAQTEELAEQNEEIEAQSEEVTRQNEDLVDLNYRLTGREEILQGLLQSSQQTDSIPRILDELCRRTLVVMGLPAAGIAVLENKNGLLMVLSQIVMPGTDPIPATWPVNGSIAEAVLKERRTAYVSDLTRKPDLAEPFGAGSAFKSVLATPVTLSGSNAGLLVACSTEPSHWTEEQFRILEWVAAQCSLVIETLQSQKALAEHARALEEANHSKDRFLAMLSHELRTPLTPVLAAAGVLEKDDRLPEDVREDFRMIRRNVCIQSKLIDDLLDLTRISRGKIELDRQVLSVVGLLRDTVDIVAGDVDAKSQTIQLELNQLNDCIVVGDSPRLQQVFWNLIKNAVKFSDPGSRITVGGCLEGGQAVIEISDPGLGISPEDSDRIFLPFEQINHQSRKANEGGLGLGLAIAKAIVELHGGKISVHSAGLGLGTKFIVKLPADINHRLNSSVPSTDALPKHPVPNQSAHILLVEDHGDTGRTLARMLRSAGYQVEHAETASAALQLFKERNFDLIVSDLGLPDESGLALMRRLRALRPNLRGICLSGYGMEDNIAECLQVGFKEHITKPVEISRLKTAISKVMAGQDDNHASQN